MEKLIQPYSYLYSTNLPSASYSSTNFCWRRRAGWRKKKRHILLFEKFIAYILHRCCKLTYIYVAQLVRGWNHHSTTFSSFLIQQWTSSTVFLLSHCGSPSPSALPLVQFEYGSKIFHFPIQFSDSSSSTLARLPVVILHNMTSKTSSSEHNKRRKIERKGERRTSFEL